MSLARDSILIGALAIAAFGVDRRERTRIAHPRHGTPAVASRSGAASVILVVSDGMRWQEVFRGADSLLVFGQSKALGGDPARVHQRYWRPSVAERRAALMPFIWGTVARKGQLLGNRDAGSSVNVTNGLNFSYPGYNELLVGYPDPRINSNRVGPNPNVTVFEWLNRREGFRERVAAVGAWDAFADIFNARRSAIDVHARREDPLDERSHRTALDLLNEVRPRALFVAYVETDDWAHRGRYDRTLDAVHAVDGYLAQLWSAVQAHPQYRGRTTLIFTADHGRGRTTRDWTDHNRDIAGAHETFVAMIGPAVPAIGEARDVHLVAQAQVAATVAAAVGLDYRTEVRRAAPAIRAVSVR